MGSSEEEGREKGESERGKRAKGAKGKTLWSMDGSQATPHCHRLTRVYWLYRGIRSSPEEHGKGRRKKERLTERMDNGQTSVHRALSTRMQPTGTQAEHVHVHVRTYVFYYSTQAMENEFASRETGQSP